MLTKVAIGLVLTSTFILNSCNNNLETSTAKYSFFEPKEIDFDSLSSIMLPYCKILVSEKFVQLLKQNPNLPEYERLKYALDSTMMENLVLGIFIGGGERKLKKNEERGSSDSSPSVEYFIPNYYFHKFSNYSNQFVATVPCVPKKYIAMRLKKKLSTQKLRIWWALKLKLFHFHPI
jgi:hypothetical protein